MPPNDNNLSGEFEGNGEGSRNDAQREEVEPDGSDMIKNHHPHPEPRPPWDTAAVDAEIHNQALAREDRNARRGHDAFDQIDAQHAGLRPNFNRQSAEPLAQNFNRQTERAPDAFDQIDANAARLEQFNTQARGREPE